MSSSLIISDIKDKFTAAFSYVKQITFGKNRVPYIDIDNKELSVNDLIVLLRLIGSINKDEKINIQTLEIMKNSWYTSFIRTLINDKNEGKKETLEFIYYVINDSFKQISSKTLNEADRRNLIKAIRSSIVGMKNIKECYSSDKTFACFIDSLIEDTIETKLKGENIENVKGEETKEGTVEMENVKNESESVYVETSEFDEL